MQVQSVSNNQTFFKGNLYKPTKYFCNGQELALNAISEKYKKILNTKPYSLIIKNNFEEKTVSLVLRHAKKPDNFLTTETIFDVKPTSTLDELTNYYDNSISNAIKDYDNMNDLLSPMKIISKFLKGLCNNNTEKGKV